MFLAPPPIRFPRRNQLFLEMKRQERDAAALHSGSNGSGSSSSSGADVLCPAQFQLRASYTEVRGSERQ